MPNPFNRDEGEQAPAEEATQQPVDPSSEPPTTDMSAGDDGAEDDRYAFEEAEQREEGSSGAGAAAGAGAGAGAAAGARVSQEAPSGGGNGGPYRSEDGATLGRDFNIPGVDPEDDGPYRGHTGEKRDHGG